MLFHERFQLPRDDQHDVALSWSERQKQRPVQSHDPSLHGWLATEDAWKAFHDGHMNANEAALSMRQPLSASPAPALGRCSDHILAVGNSWRVIISALVEWPSIGIPDIFALLHAIARAPGNLHKGEAVGDEGEKLTWAQVPYFDMIWHESSGADIRPGQIRRQYCDPTLVALARKLYLKMKDIEAQLGAQHVLTMNKAMIQLIVQALEKKVDQSDGQLAPNEATGYIQAKLDFNIPAVSLMLKSTNKL